MKTNHFYRIAKRQLDEGEISGAGSNAHIVGYLLSTSLSSQMSTTDETPWCSAFVNWCVERAGVVGTNSAAAVSWMNWGVPTDSPTKGTITIFQWSNGGHHVGFFNSFEGNGKVNILGGNQSNTVKISSFDESAVIGYRNPTNNFFSRPVKIVCIALLSLSILGGIAYYIHNRKHKKNSATV